MTPSGPGSSRKPASAHGWALGFVWWLWLWAASGARADCELRMAWSADRPYMMRDAAGQMIGIDFEIALEAMRRLNCRLVLREQPFARSLHSLEAGELDMVAGAFKRPEREAYAWFSAPVYEARKRLYLRRAALKDWRAHSLREWLLGGAHLGVLPGVSYGPEFTALSQDPTLSAQFHTVVHRKNLWLMLQRGRIDGMLADELTAADELRQLGLSDAIASAPLVVASEPTHTAFGKRTITADFVRRYDEAVAAMRREGRIAALFRRYGTTMD